MNLMSAWTSKETLKKDVLDVRLENDTDLREIYEFGMKLGQGSFGVVYEATHIERQTKWAIKEVCRPAPGSSKVVMVDNEIEILKQVNHAHIIRLQAVYRTATMIYLVTELCKGGDLRQLLQRKKFFTEDETRNIICSLADAVVYLHRRAIVHRDLKLENILVKNSVNEDDSSIDIKVTDFGLSVKTGGAYFFENMMTEACGTLIYMAPEMMSDHGYSHLCDVWSIGVVMYMLLCGEPPFTSKTKTLLLKEIVKKEVRFPQPIWATVSDAAKNLLTRLLKVDPAYRMSANQLLENPWITGDTNVPAVPPNVFEMMCHYVEQEEKTQPLAVSSLTSSEDTLEPFPIPPAVSPETNSNCSSNAKHRPETNSSSCASSASSKLYHGTKANKSGGTVQDRRMNSSDTPRQPPTTQSHAGVKPSAQPSVKQRRPQDKKDFSRGQKPPADSRNQQNRGGGAATLQQASITQGLQNYTNKLLPNSYAVVYIIKPCTNQT
ncbi:serine/threonine-protein kinase 33 isoform X2 [Acanthochromis polyacanthus]|uniref:serine/threonine-protein kinase 33 isoform X2 n=1 Tax=Acanthochromis polyacanthus TaxID=80966 RepID=UPI00223432AD|nr:serine/threonine-protein kinase 33 isoform X2 [Acanthochromis polyacanthus]